MRIKKRLMMICILMSILVIASSCDLSKYKIGNQEKIFVGYDSLSIEFMESAPPKNVFTGDIFQVGLKLTNKGAYNITKGVLILSLDDQLMKSHDWEFDDEQIISGEENRLTFDLGGRSNSNPQGDQGYAFLDIEAKKLDPKIADVDTNIYATACYEYETQVTQNVCIETSKFSNKKVENTCTAGTITLNNGQGSPLTVTKIETTTLSDRSEGKDFIRPQFTIYISNKGKGRIFSHERSNIENSCSPKGIESDQVDVINVDEVKFSRYSFRRGDIKCDLSKDNTIRLREDNVVEKINHFRCTLNQKMLEADLPNFETPLYIKLSYGYTDTVSVPINIETVN